MRVGLTTQQARSEVDDKMIVGVGDIPVLPRGTIINESGSCLVQTSTSPKLNPQRRQSFQETPILLRVYCDGDEWTTWLSSYGGEGMLYEYIHYLHVMNFVSWSAACRCTRIMAVVAMGEYGAASPSRSAVHLPVHTKLKRTGVQHVKDPWTDGRPFVAQVEGQVGRGDEELHVPSKGGGIRYRSDNHENTRNGHGISRESC